MMSYIYTEVYSRGAKSVKIQVESELPHFNTVSFYMQGDRNETLTEIEL